MRIALIALAIAGCKRTAEIAGPPAEISLSGSVWRAERAGDAPMIVGPMTVFVTTSKSGDRLPGIALGSSAGPELSLLGGEFAPLVIPDRTDLPHQVRITSDGSTLAIDFGSFVARIDRRIAIQGRANVVLPAGDTMLRGFTGDRPVFAERVTAWSEASIAVKHADRIEAVTERRGTIVIETDCAPRIVKPRARATTSSFILRVGPARNDFDPSYAPSGAVDDAPPCTGTATISVKGS